MKNDKEIISELVTKFNRNFEEYKNPIFNETQVRIEFVNPFWKALGWDVDNINGNSLSYRDVVHEDSLKIGRTTKAPDYSFQISGSRKFFVETKKPAIDLKHNPAPAFQLRRYAYSAKLPISILTDFEEFIIYDCRMKPALLDKPHVGRMLYYTFEEYLDKWNDLYNLLSKEAVMQGELDRYIKSKEGKKPKTEIDRDFLNDLDTWRIQLARNIAIRNPQLNEHELNYAVQLTIDRLIFLRMSEDRGIETQFTLQALLAGENTYRRLVQVYYKADERYNSGLFHFEEKDGVNPDTITPELSLDDKILKDIIGSLYYPKCPYEFSVLPVEVLGNAYEQFLGKQISLTKGHHARIEEKPEVRKAGGVYYTPKYIVDYIVKNTVGKLCENKSAKEVSELRILDPACGSGSFLLGAFQYLLDWHLEYYKNEFDKTGQIPSNPNSKGKRKQKHQTQVIFQGVGDNWYLSTAEKKRILINNIYGVDIDANAVEVTKLSLLLKVLENENSETLNRQLGLWHQRALPNLESNIKCGNSLIGPDFYNNQQSTLFDEEEIYRINVFDWQSEFKEIFSNDGFDAVIGNPPYVFGRDWKALNISDNVKIHLGNKYKSSPYQLDFFSIFMEKASILSKIEGRIGLIVPNVWLTNTYSSSTRNFILNQANELILTVPPQNTFQKLTVDTIIYHYKKSNQPDKTFLIKKMHDNLISIIVELEMNEFNSGEKPISTTLNKINYQILSKIRERGINLGELCNITRGVHPYRLGGYGKSAFTEGVQIERDLKERPYHSTVKKSGYSPFIYGKDLKRMSPVQHKEYVKYGVWLAEPRNPNFFEGDRIYSRKILGKSLIVTFVNNDSVADQQVYISKPKDNNIITSFITGVLASKLMSFYIRNYFDEINDAFPQIKVSQLKQLPIAKVNKGNILHDNITNQVNQILDLNKKLSQTKDPQSQKQLQRQIDATDNKIDQLVYQLYGLTEEEIQIVEEEIG